MSEIGVLFVCLGNICRSPTAEGIFREKLRQAGIADRVCVDSAGTGGWHAGEAPDRRAQAAARQRGYDISALRARQVTAGDFLRFDHLLAMDFDNLAALRQMAPAGYGVRAELYLDALTTTAEQPASGKALAVKEVPDPYYGGEAGFQQVIDLLEMASDVWVARLAARLRPSAGDASP